MHEKDYCNLGGCRTFIFGLGQLLIALAIFFMPTQLGNSNFTPVDMGVECLASAVYYEARGEPVKGQRAVVDVVMHRAYKSGKTYCEILRAKGQFQWTKHKPMRYDAATMKLLESALRHPKILINENFLFFHSTSVKPVWAAKMSCKRIGNHHFCMERAWTKNDR